MLFQKRREQIFRLMHIVTSEVIPSVNDIAWQIGNLLFYILDWFEEIETRLSNLATPIPENTDAVNKELDDLFIRIRSHKNRSQDVINSLETLFSDNDKASKLDLSLAGSIVILREKITDVREIIQKVDTLAKTRRKTLQLNSLNPSLSESLSIERRCRLC